MRVVEPSLLINQLRLIDSDYFGGFDWSILESPLTQVTDSKYAKKPSQTLQSLVSYFLEEPDNFELEHISFSQNPFDLQSEEYKSGNSIAVVQTISEGTDLLEKSDRLFNSLSTHPNLKRFPNMMDFCRALNFATNPKTSDDYKHLDDLERVLFNLCFEQRRRNPLRKEQVYKKVINLCFKLITREFEIEFYEFNKLPKKAIKVEMLKHFFRKDADSFILREGKKTHTIRSTSAAQLHKFKL